MEIIKKEHEENKLGYRRITKKYPGFGFTESGVKDAIARLKAQGAMDRQAGSGRRKSARTPSNVAKVKAIIEENPSASKKAIADGTGISRTGASNILKKDLRLKSLTQIKVQQIRKKNIAKRLEICSQWKQKMENSWDFDPRKVFWADEKVFRLGKVEGGNQNFRVWAEEHVKKAEVENELIIRGEGGQQGGGFGDGRAWRELRRPGHAALCAEGIED